jgi:hypothetical protein
VFTFDSFRVKNGKVVEHWDGAVINLRAAGANRGDGYRPELAGSKRKRRTRSSW